MSNLSVKSVTNRHGFVVTLEETGKGHIKVWGNGVTLAQEQTIELRDWLNERYPTQSAAGEPEQQTAINADDLPTKKYPLGAFDFEAPVAAGEPVAWRYRTHSNGPWYVTTNQMHARVFDRTEDGGQVQGLFTGGPPAAAHGGEAEMTFEYVGPRNERKTVEVTREEVADHLDYMLFEKLTAAVCGCDPAEADDCRCDEYAEQFTMRAQAGEGGEM